MHTSYYHPIVPNAKLTIDHFPSRDTEYFVQAVFNASIGLETRESWPEHVSDMTLEEVFEDWWQGFPVQHDANGKEYVHTSDDFVLACHEGKPNVFKLEELLYPLWYSGNDAGGTCLFNAQGTCVYWQLKREGVKA